MRVCGHRANVAVVNFWKIALDEATPIGSTLYCKFRSPTWKASLWRSSARTGMPQNPCSASHAENTVEPSSDSNISLTSGSGNCSMWDSRAFSSRKSLTQRKPADEPSARGFLLTSSIGEHHALVDSSSAPIATIRSTSLSKTSFSYLDILYGRV